MSKLRLWQAHADFDQAERAWDQGSLEAASQKPLKKLDKLPNMVGITPATKRFLTLKSLFWMVSKDEDYRILKYVMKKPLTHGFRYLKSLFKKIRKEGDFYFYGIKSLGEFEKLLKENPVFVVGFSYCHKPYECPSGRFTSECIHDPDHPVCRQCFIGKAVNALPLKDTYPLFIPTIHYIGEEVFKLMDRYPNRQIVFLITACEMTLEMFGDLGNMAGIKGLGVRLDGRICNTMKAFELSEQGIKPGLTVVLEPTQKKILELLKVWNSCV